MRIAKPLLLTGTPVGVIWGVVVAYHMHPWLGWLMMALLSVISLFIGYTVHIVRREKHAQENIDSMSRKIT